MHNVLTFSRKAFTATVVAATIAWSVGLAALVAPLTVKAAPASGSLVKASLPAVYYVGQDGKRYVFPNEKTYKTWYSDFSSVQVITDAELAALMIGGNVTYRPGIRMVKIQSDPKTYAVDKGGALRWVKSEAVAVALYGANWNQMIDDVPDAFFTNYTVGADVNSAADYSPASASAGSTTINQDKNLGSGGTGGLSYSLSSGTPAGSTVPRGATSVNFLKFDVRNGGSAAQTVDTVTLHRVGPGATGDFAALYLFEGNTRLTTSRTVNNSTNEATFTNLGLRLAAGETRSLWVAADIGTGAGSGNVHAFQVTKVAAGTSMANGVARGSDMTLTSVTTGTITIAASGALVNPKVAQMNAKVGEFQLNSGTSEDIELRRITLFQAGSLSRSNLMNLVLKQGGNTLATATGVDDRDRVTFVLTAPQLLEKGATKTYEVYADVSGSARANDTVHLFTEEGADVYAVGRTFGYGATVTRTNYNGGTACNGGTSGNAPHSTAGSCTAVEGGQITIAFNGPAAKDIATNGKDVELFNFSMSSQANVEVRQLSLGLATTGGNLGNGTTAFYTDVKVVDTATGSVIAGPLDSTTAASAAVTMNFTDIFNLSAGQSRTLKVTADVASATTPGEKITVTLNAFGSNTIRNLDNSTFVQSSNIVPSSNIAGNAHTVRSPSLTVSASSTPVAQTYIQGSQNVELGGFNLKAGDASDVKVTNLTVRCMIDDTSNGFQQGQDTVKCSDNLLSAKLWHGTTQLGDTKSPTTSTADGNGGLLQFTNLNLTVPKGQTVTLKVSGSLSSAISSLPNRLQMRITSPGDLSVQDPDGNTFSATPSASLDGSIMTVSSAGSLTATLAPDDTESEAGLVVAGSSNAVLAKYRFTAQNEELKVTKARVSVAAASVAALASLSLYDGSTLVGGPVAVDSNGNADFAAVEFVIPKDASKTLTVKGNLNSVGPSGAASGLDLKLTLGDGSVSGTFEARGTSAGSSTTVATLASTVAGNSKILRKTKPTVAVVALPSSTLTNGTIVVARFSVAADPAEQVSLKKVSVNIAINGTLTVAVGATGATEGIREVGQGSNVPSTNSTSGTCNASGTCTVNVLFDSEQSIAAGTSKTYELRATLSGVDTAGESISSSLTSDTEQVTGELDNNNTVTAAATGIDDLDATAAAFAAYNFLWSDNSAVPHNDVVATDETTDASGSSNDWTNGRFVKLLPSDTQTMTRS